MFSSSKNAGQISSQLFDQDRFYDAFIRDLRRARLKVIIESPFLSVRRIEYLLPTLQMLIRHGVRIIVNTKPPEEQELVNIILANVGTVIAFRSGSPRDEELLLSLFQPYIDPGEIANLPAYNLYCLIAAVQAQEPLSGETMLLSMLPDQTTAEEVRNISRKNYGRAPIAPKKEQENEEQPKRGRKSKKRKKQGASSISSMKQKSANTNM